MGARIIYNCDRNILQILTTTILQWAHGLFTNIDYNYFTNRVTISYNRVQQAGRTILESSWKPSYNHFTIV